MYRQGDVLLHRVEKTQPEGEPMPREGGRIVLQRGSATGHAHAIASPGADLYQTSEGRVLVAREAVTLAHEEHTHIEIPAGVYAVVQQREYTPEEVRDVQD